jgi:PAS domain S-box-containing protein
MSQKVQQPLTILNAGGDGAGLRALSGALARAGFDVREAASGADALRLAADQPAAIILADALPDLSGPEVCSRLKADPATAPIPVLYLAPPSPREEGTPGPEQAEACLSTPVGPTEVVATVSALLRLRPAQERAWSVAREWRSLFDHLGDGIGLLDTDGRFLRCNKALAGLLGRPIGEVLGRHYDEVVPPPLAGGPGRPFLRMLHSHRRETAELALGARWFRVTADPALAPDGTLAGAVFVLADITAQVEARRRAAEQAARAEAQARALAESEARFHFLADAIPDLVWAARDDGYTDFYSRRFLEYLGKTVAEVQGWAWVETLHPEDRERCRAAWAEAVVSGTPYEAEYRIRRHDGVYRWHVGRALPMRDDAGRIVRWYGTCADIHDRRLAEQARQEAGERMRSVVDHVLDGIITIDESGIIETFNPAAERLFGYRAGEVAGRNVKVLMPEPYHSQHDGYLWAYLQTGVAKVIGIGREVVGLRKDGSTFPMELAVSAFRLGGRRFFTGIVRDITERKRLERELRRRAEELAHADRKKDEFLALLAHELRGPLAPLVNALDVLRLRSHDPGTLATARELAERQVRQLARLVDDLLDVSRIARGKLVLKKERVDAARLVSQAVEVVRPLMEARNHQLTVLLPPEPVELEADPTRVVQVLTNLLTNAAKYTEPGGGVWVSAERDRDDVLLKVRDTGMGLPADLLPRLFELFAQAESGSQGGLGIGLHLVRGLVEMHGGSVLAFSEGPGEGSEFVVRLPALPVEARGGEAAAARPEAAGPPRRVLVVDDDIDGATSLAMVLRLRGHETKVAHDGFAALEVARSFRPEVVLLDLALPGGLDGYDVARKLRGEEVLRDARIVALTGWGQEEDRQRAVQAGFDEFLVKPAGPQALERLLARQGD